MTESDRVHLWVEPQPALVDRPISIRAEGLAPHQSAVLRAQLTDDFGTRWSSWASFVVSASGSLDPARDPARRGSYVGTDRQGLLWSMEPDSEAEALEHPLKSGLDPTTLQVELEQGGEVLARARTELLWLGPGVGQTMVDADGLVGCAFTPASGGPFRPVLVFGGSDGGLRLDLAALLAGHGFFTLALAYFRSPGLPEELVNIPLEYFGKALNWLRRDRRSDPSRGVGVVGRSRGGELALLLGSTFREVDAVVAFVASGVVHSGIVSGPESWQAEVPAWTLADRPLPFLGHLASEPSPKGDGPLALTPIYCRDLRDWAAVERAEIPVERSQAAILMLSGGADAMWPSALLSELAVARLARSRYPHPVRHLVFPEAGHRFVLPSLPGTVTSGRHPADGRLYDYGGSAAGNAAAGLLAHQAMVDWLSGPPPKGRDPGIG